MDIKEIINNMYEIEFNQIKETVKKSKEYGIKIEKSSLYDFSLSNLFDVIIIDRYQDLINIDDLEIIQHTLSSPVNDEILENIDNRKLISIKENLIRNYLADKEFIKKESKEFYKNYKEDQEYYEFIIFNINNNEINITDSDNIGRYGSSDEVLVFDLPNIF